jgi:hypothetical protein
MIDHCDRRMNVPQHRVIIGFNEWPIAMDGQQASSAPYVA